MLRRALGLRLRGLLGVLVPRRRRRRGARGLRLVLLLWDLLLLGCKSWMWGWIEKML